MIPVEDSPGAAASDILQARAHHPQPAPMAKARVKVSIAPQLWRDPALPYSLFVALQFCRREIVDEQSFKNRFGGQHAALNRRVNSLQAGRVQKPRAISDNQDPVGVHLRHRVPAAGGNRLGAVTNHLAAAKQLRHEWMRLKSLELSVRIDERIAIIKPGHVAEIQDAVLHSINPATPVRPLIGRKAERVRDSSGRITIVGQFPKFLYAEAINLRLASFIQAQPLN